VKSNGRSEADGVELPKRGGEDCVRVREREGEREGRVMHLKE
jgi:hypothetical protein